MKGGICVVLSTYNGERYLSEQLDSLLRQTVYIDRIHIRDDGSIDSTRDIIKHYAASYPNITFEFGNNLGWRESFPVALADCEGYERYAFCDQDDVWLPQKLERAISVLDGICEDSEPCIYAGNVVVSDKDLIPKFTFNREPKDIETRDLPHTLTYDDMAGGLTYVFNSMARKMLLDCPTLGLTGHDRLLMLICKVYGRIAYDFESYVLYRQHESNVYGCLEGGVDGSSRCQRFFRHLRFDDRRPALAAGLLALGSFCACSAIDNRYLSLCSRYRAHIGARTRLLLSPNIGAYSWKQDLKLRIKILLGTY